MLSSSSSEQQDDLRAIQHMGDGHGFVRGAPVRAAAIRIHQYVNIGPAHSIDIVSNVLISFLHYLTACW